MLMMSAAATTHDPKSEWYDKFIKESAEKARLKLELDTIHAQYDSLLEASLQQLASRADEYTQPLERVGSSGSSVGTTLLHTSSGSLTTTTATPNPLSVSISDDHPLPAGVSALTDKKIATPKKKKGGFFGKKKDKKEKDPNKGIYPLDERTEFALPLAPSTSYQHLPRLQVCPLVSHNHVVIAGPTGPVGPIPKDDSGTAHYLDIVAGRSISTYPHIPGNPSRDGDPIADRFSAHVFENRVIAAVADGCNWGPKPREAAQKANSAMTDVKKAGAVLLSAFEYAHNSIMEGKLAFWDAGTTTLLGGVLLEINKGTDKWIPQWEFVCASVGDCKAFCYSNGEITDITHGNRQNACDPRDCGGRLGPHLDEGKPDLRNLNLFCAPCEDGDLIIIVTDGIHDNLDPQHLGIVPKDMPKERFNLAGDKWDSVDAAKATIAKNAYITELLLRLLKNGEETPTPKEVADRLVSHCIEVTQKSRDYMENNQGKRLPEDYIEFPGKMDHTTCLCFRVGRFPTLPEKSTILTSGSAPLPASASLSPTPTANSSPSLAISTTPFASNGSQLIKEDGSPRLGSHSTVASPKFDNWTKISPSTKHL